MDLQVRTYGNIRDAVGTKEFVHETASGENVGDVLSDLSAEFGTSLTEDFEEGALLVLKNGTHIRQLDGLDTTLAGGDRLSLTSPPMPEG